MFDLTTGLLGSADASNALGTGFRAALGTFFLISGYHKAFNTRRRATLRATFEADGCYSPAIMVVIPAAELLGGLALLLGFLTPLASVGLALLCLGATCLDGFKRIRQWAPLDAADALDDVLYLPEVLYALALIGLAAVGPGTLSLDHLIQAFFL